MYTVVRKTKKFFTDKEEDMKEYDRILTDPLCSVISSWREKQINSEFDEGKLIRTVTDLVMVLSWEERQLL